MKVSILIPHFRSWEWLAVCLWHFRKYPMTVPHEIICINNSLGDPSIKVATETELGEGVKVYPGQADFTSHGQGYNVGYGQAAGDWIFTSETDSFPIAEKWFDSYEKQMNRCSMVGPMVPQSSGYYVHPAGCLYNRTLIEDAIAWQRRMRDWVFLPGLAQVKGLADWGYHVVLPRKHPIVAQLTEAERQHMELWSSVGPFQEMRSFDPDDHLSTYTQRTGIHYFQPRPGVETYLRVGYESGQWLHYFAATHGYRVVEANNEIKWIPELEGQQAAYSKVFGNFYHAWGGTVYSLLNDYSSTAKDYKVKQREAFYGNLPEKLRNQIEELRANS